MNGPQVLLIDDHAMFRTGLGLVIGMGMPQVSLVQAASVDEALANALLAPQAVLLDIKLGGMSGLEGIAHIHKRWPHVPVLMLSSQDTPQTRQLALTRGAQAFVSKSETAETIMELLRQALYDGMATPPRGARADGERHLTQRQREVLSLLHEGLPNKLIARRLLVSENTVRRHVQDILEFFQVDSRAEAVNAARHQALVD